MTRHVALLRAINLGAKNRIAMADLRSWVADLGHTDVVTYIASGNVVFTAAAGAGSDDEIARGLEATIAAESGLTIDVVIRTGTELVDAIEANPFPDAEGSHLLLGFLGADLPAERSAGALDALATAASGGEEFALLGRTLYLSLPNGAGRSKLAMAVGKGLAGTAVTTRNITTVGKLAALAGSAD